MKSTLSLLILILFSVNLFAQKLYIWCPKDEISTPRLDFLDNDTIDLVVFDGRIFTEKSKVECTSENTISQMTGFIKSTYPSATMNVLNPSQYYKEPIKNRITVKIGISAFHAAFGADVKVGFGNVGGNFSFGVFPEGKWNAVTVYAVKIFDYRYNLEVKKTKDIYKIASKSNMGGYITAKNILNTTYIEANQELLFFIEASLIK